MTTISSTLQTSSSLLLLIQQTKKSDVSGLAQQLFSSLDTAGQGYIDESTLASALSSASSTSGTTSSSSDAQSLFTALDSNSDGKVTESELQSALQSVSDQLDSQVNSFRMQISMENAPPPPPPPPSSDDQGFTKDELQSQLDEIGSSDSTRSSFISNVVNNFDAADTNGDGKVTFAEASAYNQSLQDSSSTSTSYSYSSTTSTDSSSSGTLNASAVQQILDLVKAYTDNESAITGSSISTNA